MRVVPLPPVPSRDSCPYRSAPPGLYSHSFFPHFPYCASLPAPYRSLTGGLPTTHQRALRTRTLCRGGSHLIPLSARQWILTRQLKPSFSHPFTVLQGGPQKMSSSHSPVRVASARQKSSWGSPRHDIGIRSDRADDTHPTRTEPKRDTPVILTQKTPVTGCKKNVKNATGDTAMLAGGDILLITTKPARKIGEGGATGHPTI